MTPGGSKDRTATGGDTPIEVVRHEEQVHIGVTRAPFRKVRIHRRIVTETRTIEVEVRTEVLDIDWLDLDPTDPVDPAGETGNPERLEFVLHGEEPEIRLVTVPRERIILTRVTVPGTTDVQIDVRAERITIETTRPHQ